jgi:hypothetical protein
MRPTKIDGEPVDPVDGGYVRETLIQGLQRLPYVSRVEPEEGGIYLETLEQDGLRCFLILLEVKRL